MRLAVTGARGMLGRAIVAEARTRALEVVALGLEEMDVTDAGATLDVLAATRPQVVVHCAAYTDVDRAEAERERVLAVNEGGTRNVARACLELDAALVYLSTDYVFDGRSRVPYRPSDVPNPINAYGRSKLAGEEVVRESGTEWLIVRTSWLYGQGGRNFVDMIMNLARERPRLEVVNDQRGRPTWTESVAPTLLDLILAGARGVYHAADSGEATWYELAVAALELAGLGTPVKPIPASQLARPAPRPAYSVLDISGTEAMLGRTAPHWRDSLAHYLGA